MPITYPPQSVAANVATVDGTGYIFGDPSLPGIKVIRTEDGALVSRSIWAKDEDGETEIVSSGD